MFPKDFYLSFQKKEEIAKDTYSFYFDRRGYQFDFFSGQYIRMTLPTNSADGRSISRFFTIASSPLEKEHLIITTKTGISEFKKILFALKVGEQVKFFGSIGGFYLDENDTNEKVFLAGGIGITPFYSMITYIFEKRLTIPITLFVSFSLPEEKVFYNELKSISQKNNNIRTIYTITYPENSQEEWAGETGRISEEMIKKYISDITKPTFYVVGSSAMVINTEELLENMGIIPEKIKVEQFTGY